METSFKITREYVFRQVARRMEWEGTRSPLEDDSYGRVSVSESDRSLLHGLFDEAAMHAIDIFRPFLLSASNTDEALTLHIDLPTDAEEEGITIATGNMVTAHVLALWQEIVSPARAGSSYERRDDYAGKIHANLYHHRAPRRQTN